MPGNVNYSGQIIGNYLVQERLGSGEFGSVYRAQNRVIAERIVAIKLINDKYVSSQQECEQFIHEARVLLRLKHPHVLPVIDIGEQDGVPYMVLEFAANGSLRNFLAQQSGKPLPPEQAVKLIEQIGQGLQYAHQQGIVHRDLKPDNILFSEKDEALLADFGIATELPTATFRNAGAISGTPPYMAPEQFQGIVSKMSDQYALGCIAYELVTGRKLFEANNIAIWGYKHGYEKPIPPRQFNPALPEYVEEAILRTIAKDRTQRFPDIAAFLAALSPPTMLAQPSQATLKSVLGQRVLGSADLTIGRAPDNILVLSDRQASSHHAVIRRQGLGYIIIDLNSTNKTFVREQAIPAQEPRMLQSGDRIRIGETVFEYTGENGLLPAELPPTVAVSQPTPALVAPPTPVVAISTPPIVSPPATPTPARLQGQGAPPFIPPAYAPPPFYPTLDPRIQRAGSIPPRPEPPRKKHIGLWITLISALIIIAVIIGIVVHAVSTPPPLAQVQKSYQGTIIDSDQHSRTMTLSSLQETTSGNLQGEAGFACNTIDFCGTTPLTGAVKTDRTITFTIAFKTSETITFSGNVSSDNLTLSNGKYSGNGVSGTWTGQNSPATLPELFSTYSGTMDFGNSILNITITITNEDANGNLQGKLHDQSDNSDFTLNSSSVNTNNAITFQTAIFDGNLHKNSTLTYIGTVAAASSGESSTTKLSGTYSGTADEHGSWSVTAS
jgi:serine/threonine protein kinase